MGHSSLCLVKTVRELAKDQPWTFYDVKGVSMPTSRLYLFILRNPLRNQRINHLPSNKILDVTKLKAFADDKLNIASMMISLLDRIENAVGKGENAGYQHFLLFPQCFPQSSSLGSLKVGIVW